MVPEHRPPQLRTLADTRVRADDNVLEHGAVLDDSAVSHHDGAQHAHLIATRASPTQSVPSRVTPFAGHLDADPARQHVACAVRYSSMLPMSRQ
jgi:hypothetical protein